MAAIKSIILARYLLTGKGEVKEDWGIRIEGSKIAEVNSNSELLEKYPNYSIRDYRNKILSPGFVNSHMHFYGILSHGITSPDSIEDFESFLKDFWWPMVEDRLTPEMIKAGLRSSGLELINSGVTAVSDILEAPKTVPGILEAEAEVSQELGLRTILSLEASERVDAELAEQALEENNDFSRDHESNDMVSGKQCLHTTFTCSHDYIREAFSRARSSGAGMQLHLSESQYEVDYTLQNYGSRPVEVYDELGVLGDDLLASQAVKVNEKEIKLLKENGVKIAHQPISNCEVGGGVAPVPEMLEEGIPVGLGTDGYINNFFEVMRVAFLIQKGHRENPALMPPKTVYNMATEQGAEATGIEEVGVIEEGNFADVITINASTPTPVNSENIYEQTILYRNPDDVKEVIINGEIVKQKGEIKEHNYEEVKQNAQNLARILWGEK